MHLCNYSSPTTLCQTYLAHELTISDEHVFDLVIHYRKLLTSKAVASCSLLQLKKHYTFPNHSDQGYPSWYLWRRALCILLLFKSPHLDLFWTNALQSHVLIVVSSIWKLYMILKGTDWCMYQSGFWTYCSLIYMGMDIAIESCSWSHVGFIFFFIVFIPMARYVSHATIEPV